MHRAQNDRVSDVVEQEQITQLIHSKPGLTFNPDGSRSQTPANVAAMGRHYVDRPPASYAQPGQRPVGLGEHRDLAGNPRPTADYANYYGTWAWERIFAAEDRTSVA